MSEREGLYCQKHIRWCANGACEDCGAAALAKIQSLRAQAMDIGHRMVAGAVWAEDAPAEPSEPRPCEHQNGYCKDTAHKYELPVE